MTTWNDVKDDAQAVRIGEHGFVRLVDIMGDDSSICQAARCSYGAGTKSVSDDRALIRTLVRNYHTSPIEMVELKFHLKIPIFVMRQHVRHRTASLNEYSGRYSEMTDEMFVPPVSRLQVQSETNKQGSGGSMTPANAAFSLQTIENVFKDAYSAYQSLLEWGMARELARIVLPVANYTELYWKIDLKNFLGYMRLRDDTHAQGEIVDLAKGMYGLVKPLLPMVCEAYEDYWSPRNTAHLSRMELALLKQLINPNAYSSLVMRCEGQSEDVLAKGFGMSKRELAEFKAKFGM